MFEKCINEVLSKKFDRSHSRPSNRHWPSESSIVLDGNVIGSCLREKYYQRMNYPPDTPISTQSMRKMEVGKIIEQYEIALAKEAGIWVADDVAFQFEDEGIIVSGKLDAIYKYRGSDVCVEYKSSSGWPFIKRVFGGTGVNSKMYALPKLEHVLQTILYLHAKPELRYGIIFYINRDSMDTIEHKVQLKNDHVLLNKTRVNITIDMILDRYKELTEYLDTNTIPPADFTPAYREDDIERLYADKVISKYEYDRWTSTGEIPCEKRCNYCQWHTTCRGHCDGDASSIDTEEIDTVDDAGYDTISSVANSTGALLKF